MDSTGKWRNYTTMMFYLMVFNTTSCHQHPAGNSSVSSEREKAGTVSRQHMLPWWYRASVEAVVKPGTHTSHSPNRWPTQMAFSKSVYSFQVKEDTLPGTVVGKVDALLESLTPITYSVQEDDGESQFLLSPVSGEFLLSRSLDFETQRFFVLTVQVQQGDSQVSSVRVYFNVLDVNDNPPVFNQQAPSASLLEDTHTGTCFLTFNVTDKDEGDNSKLDLRVVSGDEDKVFVIHSTSNNLCVNKGLDRERQSIFNLTITATDRAQPLSSQLTSTAHVLVLVEDVNDNPPVFVSANQVYIAENTPLLSVITTVQAEDQDIGPNGNVWYYLDNDSNGKFSIDGESGKIYLEEMLDREEVDTLTFTVRAADEGSPSMETTMNVTVSVEDVNDHDPEMEQSIYRLTVREDVPRGTQLLQVQARDLDTGPNAKLRYRLMTTDCPFVVDAVRGVLTVMDVLDRETESNYTLTVTALDQGLVPRSATATVFVSVLDVNDFVPQFSPEILVIHVTENEEDRSQLTHQVSAVDEDLGINSQIMYFIQKGTYDGLFSITPNGTLEIFHSLDKEKESLYIVIINALDSGIPRLTGTLTVHVVVDDVNDNHPEFTEEVYNTIVPEDSPIGTVFAMITATDIDDGVSGEIRYFMENTDVPFAIEETSGELFNTNILDRETVDMYRLKVIGSDMHPTQPLSNSVLVIVHVGDVNDHWPQFMNSPYVAYVPIELAPGSVVCAVRATDGDADNNADLRYSFYGQTSNLFSIDLYSGTIFTTTPLLTTDDIVVNVHVEDAGEPPKFDLSTISVRFQNASDFPLMDVDVVSHSLSEDEPVGTLVAVITAASIRAEPVSFYLASGNFEDVFHVDQSSGALTVENPLDYENKKDFSLVLEARDAGSPPFSSFTELYINVTDVNDNVPQFTQVEYRWEVFENSPPSTFFDVLAVDADSSTYGTLQYNITSGNTDNFFTIDPENGLLSTTVSLDREDIAGFNLTIEAAEQDNPAHKDRATVIVTVLDRNDNAPRFSQIFYTEVPEDAPLGQTILWVTSTDDDTEANAVTNYSLNDISDDIRFNIDFSTGHVTVVSPLDREEQDHYVLKVNANDSAWSISTDVTVVILDVNDNRPMFSDPVYTVILPETEEGVFVLQVLATDADVGKNAEIFYIIEPQNEEFWVNASSGEIYTKQPLVLRNSASEIYEFTVTALDSGNVPLYSNATVYVRLEPRNLHPPVFTAAHTLIVIPSDLAVGAELVQFTATDPDVNSSIGIEYVLNASHAADFFWVQPETGKLFLNQALTEHENLSLTLVVEARDQGFPSLTSQTEFIFQITGRNLFAPSFSTPNVTFSVPEDLPVGSVIGKIQADDRDYGPNGAITYRITPDNQFLPLAVGDVSGLLTLIRELDFEKESVYHLQVKASDGGWFAETGMLNITVVVIDVNDNPPVFSSSEYITTVPENSKIGTNVLDTKATDSDSGVNALVTYTLITGHVDKFAIGPENGTITTLEVFDFEQEQVFDLTIKASNIDGFNLFSLAHVVIYVSDVNEFTPTFGNIEFHFAVLKNVPVGAVIGKVAAIDYDQGSEGQVFYLIFGQTKNRGFEIDEHSGEIYTTRSLFKQGNSQVTLKILAKNKGIISGTYIDETQVHISVIDTNEPPMFPSQQYVANITEDSPAGTSVITVSALDQDSILDWNRIFFSIENGNTNVSFLVDQDSGVISTNFPLDRELWPVYNLTVTATDNGSPSATGTAYVIVSIGDINDNAPKLTSTEENVKENQPEGTIAAKLNASDADEPPNQGPFTYWLINPSNEFSLTPDGLLLTTRTIDREQTPAFRLLVGVRDAGLPLPLTSTAMLHIQVVDENDNAPIPRTVFIEVKYFGSSFQGGMIGNVHPEDLDEFNAFNCIIKSGPVNMFIIPNGTCELWSAPFQGEATFNITIEATDQLHFPVNNSIYVNYKGFTNVSIDNCIFFYVSSTSMNEFLSSKYLRFVKALDNLFNLQASKTHVFGIKPIGNELLLLAAVRNYNGQYVSREVASGISARHKKLLEAQSNMMISHITSDPCLTKPCQNTATCSKHINIGQEAAVQESVAVIFVSPEKEIFNCTCPVGFTGTLCEDDIDECEAVPCHNGGTCLNTAGSFNCRCQDGFSGPFCSADLDKCVEVRCQNGGTCVPSQEGYHCHCVPGFEGGLCEELKDNCRSAPCVEGSCINLQTGFFCNCPFGVSGVHCEEHSYAFEQLSFMEFPPLDRRTNLISLEFATVQRNSLLLYNPGGLHNREFLALEILDGALRLSYDLGAGPVRLQTQKQVTDGHFHNVTIRRISNMGSLLVDNCTEEVNSGFCFSKSDGTMSERTLDVGSNNVTFGGLRTTEYVALHPTQIKTHDFVGCIQTIQVNGVLLRPSMAIATFNIFDRCPRAEVSPCHSLPCKNNGLCHDMWSDYLCECKKPFTGRNCAKEVPPELVLRFNGSDYIEYVVKKSVQRDDLLKDLMDETNNGNSREHSVINIKFKTKEDGVLMFVLGQTGYIMLAIKDGKPVYVWEDKRRGRLSELTGEPPVADGVWHVLSLFGNGMNGFLSVDGKQVLNSTGQSMDLTPSNVDRIILGAAPAIDTSLQMSGFIGCVHYFNVSGYTLPISGLSVTVDVWPSTTLTQSDCSSLDVCLPSPTNAGNRSCICLHNVSNHVCDICQFRAESHALCSEGQVGGPLWLVAVILPLISILVVLVMSVCLYKARPWDATGRCEGSSRKGKQGSDNLAFSFDDNMGATDASSVKEEQRDRAGASPMRSEEFFCESNLPSLHPEPKSELEYYEIGSANNSDAISLKPTWQEPLHGATSAKTDSSQWGGVRMLFGDFEKENSTGNKSQTKHSALPNKHLLTEFHTEQTQKTCCRKRFLQTELLEPTRGLTFEEIRKLNSPLDPRPAKSTAGMDLSSGSESDSTLTSSESERQRFPNRNAHVQASLISQDLLAFESLLQQTCLAPGDQDGAEGPPFNMFQHWEDMLNLSLPYSCYAPVFEDIAHLPVESGPSYDTKSDIEEII